MIGDLGVEENPEGDTGDQDREDGGKWPFGFHEGMEDCGRGCRGGREAMEARTRSHLETWRKMRKSL